MLIGSYQHRLETKGRLAIPASFRKILKPNQAVLTVGLETCLYLLPFNTWQNLTAQLGNHPLVSQEQRQLRRSLAHTAQDATFDAQGRIRISQSLIDAADLNKTVVVAGSIDWVEIWDIDQYTKQNQTTDKEQLITKILKSNDQ